MTESRPDGNDGEVSDKELKKARMREKAREIAADIDEFEDKYGDVLTIEGQHSWYQAYSGMEEIGHGRT